MTKLAIGIQFHDDLEQELGVGKDLHDVRHCQTADNAVRIAANFHAFTSFGQSNRITGSMMAAGRDLALWHLYESQRFFNNCRLSREANAITLDAWMIDRCRSKGSNEIPRRELQRRASQETTTWSKRFVSFACSAAAQ